MTSIDSHTCGKITLNHSQSNFSDCFTKSCHSYFGENLDDEKFLHFGGPMEWQEGKDHTIYHYFCMTNLQDKYLTVSKWLTVFNYYALIRHINLF